MAGHSRGSVAHRWEIGAAWFGASLATAGIVVAAMAALPPSLENLASEVSDGRTAVAVGDTADVVVPADWILTRDGAHAVVVRTPDGVLRARLDSVQQDAATLLAETPGVEGPTRSEMLASGMKASHAHLAGGGYVAMVEDPETGENVRVVIEMHGSDIADYRPAIGLLLEGIRA